MDIFIQYFDIIFPILGFLIFIGVASIRVLQEYERGVVFTLGWFWKVKGPGLIILIPGIQKMEKIDLRTVVLDVPPQDVISKDNVSVKVNAVVYFQITDPKSAIINVEDYYEATRQLAQTTLRSVLGRYELDEMLQEREKLNESIQKILDAQTDIWGIKVSVVEIKDIDLNETMIRAIARQAEAERNRRARIISAEAEFQAAQKLCDAAEIISKSPQALQLRYLDTLQDIGGDKNTTIIFPFPLELLDIFTHLKKESTVKKK